MIKKMMAIVLAALMVLTLGIVSVNAETADGDAEWETIKVSCGYMPNLDSGSLMAAARMNGFFEKVGLDVTWYEFVNGPTEIAAMASGDLQFAQIGHGAHALCAEGQAFVIHCDGINLGGSLVANKSHEIETPQDLAGKTIAISSGTSAETLFNAILEQASLTKDDVTTIEMDGNGMVTAMVSGKIDACATWSPFNHTLESRMGDDYIAFSPEGFDFPASYIVDPNFLESNREAVVRFVAALCMAADYRSANLEEVAKEFAKMAGLEEEGILQSMYDAWYPTTEDLEKGMEDGSMATWYTHQMEAFVAGERLAEPVDINNYVLFDLMKEGIDFYKNIK